MFETKRMNHSFANSRGYAAGLVLTLALLPITLTSCAKPIDTQLYARTPELDAQWRPQTAPGKLWIGVAADGPQSRFCAERLLEHGDGGRFDYFGWAQGEQLPRLNCQIECELAYEYSGDKQARYCLGRLVANIYNADHSALLDRKIFFHEAMYTAGKQPDHTHDGKPVSPMIRKALFDQLLNYLAGERPHGDYPASDSQTSPAAAA